MMNLMTVIENVLKYCIRLEITILQYTNNQTFTESHNGEIPLPRVT